MLSRSPSILLLWMLRLCGTFTADPVPTTGSRKVLWPGKAERGIWHPPHCIRKAGSPKAMRDFCAVILCWEHLVLAQKVKVCGDWTAWPWSTLPPLGQNESMLCSAWAKMNMFALAKWPLCYTYHTHNSRGVGSGATIALQRLTENEQPCSEQRARHRD